MKYDRPELLDRLASEYVLGTMTARVRRRFQAIQRTSLQTQVAVQTWERRLSPLAQSVPPQQPSAATWEAINRRTASQTSPQAAQASAWFAWLKPALSVAFGVVATLGLVRLYPDAVVPVDKIVQSRGTLPES